MCNSLCSEMIPVIAGQKTGEYVLEELMLK
jgi:hypothetical protein